MAEQFVDSKESFEVYRERLDYVIDAGRKYLGQGDYRFNSGHEGYAVMLRHVDALWEVVKSHGTAKLDAARVAMSIVAATVCYMVHVSDDYWVILSHENSRDYTRDERVEVALNDIQKELLKARKKFPPFCSPEEGFAVLLEEFDELWDEVKANKDRSIDAYNEAKQVGAMAVSFVLDCVELQFPEKQANTGQVAAEPE